MKDMSKLKRRTNTELYQIKQSKLVKTFLHCLPVCLGKLKKQSWNNCGNKHCYLCCNIRRNSWLSDRDKLTRQEQRSNISFNEYSSTSECYTVY